MKTALLWSLIFLSAAAFSCREEDSVSGGKVTENKITAKKVIAAGNDFGINLFRSVIKAEPNSNLFISPLSVSYALGMTYNGAAGTTLKDMGKTLGLEGLPLNEANESFKNLYSALTSADPKVNFNIANSIWYADGYNIENDFLETNSEFFNALVKGINFTEAGTAKKINGWVKEKTNGKIPEIIEDPAPQDIIMLLINAVYFKGSWSVQFADSLSSADEFTSSDGTKHPCVMMKTEGEFGYFENELVQVLDLPYGDNKFSMTVIMPRRNGSAGSLTDLITPENYYRMTGALNTGTVEVQFPKFSLSYEITLNDILSSLGMEVAFTSRADFSKMSRTGNLFINRVKHKSFIEVNEEGTEAAAVTAVDVRETSIGPGKRFFKADRAFIFVIRETTTQSILFAGKIEKPQAQ